MRLAWFSPVAPVRTGIAGRSAELIAALRARGAYIDVYPPPPSPVDTERPARHASSALRGQVRSAHDFVWRHAQQPYDLTVFQFGNSSHHDYAWPYALRYPGLVVLHDTRLHHARAALLLRERRAAEYRAEFAWNHPHANRDLAEIAIAGFDSALYYEWPMVRTLVASARLVAVHGEGTRTALLRDLEHQGAPIADTAERIVSIRLGEGEPLNRDDAQAARVRAARGIAPDAMVFGVFGGLTPEKRIPQVLGAFAAVRPHVPGARLLLAGAPAAHYDVRADIAARGLADRVIVTGYLPSDAEVTAHLAACDVSLNLRWPTARETSGPWLRALAAGLPTVVTDLVHMAEVTSLDPRTWGIAQGGGRITEDRRHANVPSQAADGQPVDNRQHHSTRLDSRARSPQPQALCIAIDILDEDHSLRLAMRRLAADPDLREQLGRAARAWWSAEHSVDAMVEDYVNAIETAMARPAPDVELPPHARDRGDRTLRALAEPFGPDVTARIRAL